DPRLPLARLRARGQLCELRATDLQFDLAEAGSFLHLTLERDLEPSTLTTILSRTEGWIAGLQLTALLLQGQRSEAEVRAFLAESLGTHRYLVEYLGEEVFSHQPEAVQSFLLHTCILPRFSAPLCAVVSCGRFVPSCACTTPGPCFSAEPVTPTWLPWRRPIGSFEGRRAISGWAWWKCCERWPPCSG